MMTRKFGRTLLYLGLIVGGFFYIYPFLWMVSASFKTLPEFARGGLSLIPQTIHWQNYLTAWREAEFSRYFLNTVALATIPTITSLISTSMAGYALATRRFPGRKIYIGGAVVMMFLPHGLTVIPVFMLIHKLGLLHTLLGVMLPSMGGSLMQALFFLGYYSSISTGAKTLEEAARVDGAGFFQTYWRIMMPLGRPMFATLGILAFISGWNNFYWPLVISLGDPKLRTLPVGLYAFRGEHITEWTLLCAGTTMALIPIILLFLFFQRYIIEGLAGAIKM